MNRRCIMSSNTGVFIPGIENVSIANFRLLDEEYARKRKVWKAKAPAYLLHPDNEADYASECGKCWLAKQSLLLYNPEIYIWDGIDTKYSNEELQKIYDENVKTIRACNCLGLR